MTTNPNLDLAREWAQLVGPGAASNIGRAAAEVITSLPDEWIDAAKLREVIEGWRTTTNQTMHRVNKTYKSAAADIEALLPTPKPRTLADMTRDEREACQWMQADFDHGYADPPLRVVIGKCHGGTVDIILSGGGVSCVYTDKIIPLPDLPRMVWPEEQATEEAPDPPRPEDVPEKEPWVVEFRGTRHVGVRDPHDSPNWALARMDGCDINFAGDYEVTPVSRLVPEKEQA